MSDLLYSRLRVSATVDIFDGRLYAGQTVELREGRVYDATTGRYILDLGLRGTPGGARAWARFERATAAYTRTAHAIAVSSGTDALLVALVGAGPAMGLQRERIRKSPTATIRMPSSRKERLDLRMFFSCMHARQNWATRLPSTTWP